MASGEAVVVRHESLLNESNLSRATRREWAYAIHDLQAVYAKWPGLIGRPESDKPIGIKAVDAATRYSGLSLTELIAESDRMLEALTRRR